MAAGIYSPTAGNGANCPPLPCRRFPFEHARQSDVEDADRLAGCHSQHGHGGWAGWSGAEYFRFFSRAGCMASGIPAIKKRPPIRLTVRAPGSAWRASSTCRSGKATLTIFWAICWLEMRMGSGRALFRRRTPSPEFMAQMLFSGQENERDTRIPRLQSVRRHWAPATARQQFITSICAFLAWTSIQHSASPRSSMGFCSHRGSSDPLPFLDGVQYQPECSADLSDSMAAQAPPHQAERLAETSMITMSNGALSNQEAQKRGNPPLHLPMVMRSKGCSLRGLAKIMVLF